MSKGGRKGRISNELVAASCAAILAVYASGYVRTREDARRLGSEAQTRRPVRPAAAVPAVPISELAPVAAVESPPAESAPALPPAVELQPAAVQPLQAAVPGASASASPTPAAAEPGKPAVLALASIAVEQKSQPEPVADAAAAADESLPPPPSAWHDGYFTGWGTSPHGDIEAWLTIKDGKIIEAGILRCETRYPCSVIDRVIHQPVEWQSPDVDRVSRATESADAYYFGLVEALKKSAAWAAPASAG